MEFTVEQMNLMCIFDTTSRVALLMGIQDAMPDVEDAEMREIMLEVFDILAGMSDAAFDAIDFIPASDFEEMEE
jgi:hypothetical protein